MNCWSKRRLDIDSRNVYGAAKAAPPHKGQQQKVGFDIVDEHTDNGYAATGCRKGKTMNIKYTCECDDWTKFFVKMVLNNAKVASTEFEVFAADDRRIYMHTKVWDDSAKPTIIGLMKGGWVERTWVIKYELEEPNKYQTMVEYLLYDWEPSRTYDYKISDKMEIHHWVPTEIHRGFFRITQEGNAVIFTPIIYAPAEK